VKATGWPGRGEFGARLFGPVQVDNAARPACVAPMRSSRRVMSLRCRSASLIQPQANCSVSAFWDASAGSTGIGAEVRAPLADSDIHADALDGVGRQNPPISRGTGRPASG
jgi:hypothetical protein